MSLNTQTETGRETAASAIITEIERTADRADKAAASVSEKTSCVTRQDTIKEAKAPSIPVPQYPPLFSRIWELMENINDSLDRIEDNMRRIEL